MRLKDDKDMYFIQQYIFQHDILKVNTEGWTLDGKLYNSLFRTKLKKKNSYIL